MLWSVYYYLEGKKKSFLVVCLLLVATKPQNLIIVIFFVYINEFFEFKNKKLFFITSVILLAPLLFYAGSDVMDKFNQIRLGLFAEAYGSYKGLSYENTFIEVSLDWQLLTLTVKSFFSFAFAPIFNMTGMSKIIVVIESFVLYAILFNGLRLSRNKKHFNVAIIWLIVLLASFLMYAMVLFNDGTIHRYRLAIIYFVFIGYSLHKSIFLKKKHA